MADTLPGALAPKFDLVGPSVDDDLRRLIRRYGADQVKEGLKRLTTAKRGRKKLPDWSSLRQEIDVDARAWLDGRDPFKERTAYAIAKAYADANPGHSYPATFDRIKRKLRDKRHGRRWYVFVRAMEMSDDAYPYRAHLRALEELSKCDSQPVWQSMLDRARANIADYTAKWGRPSDETTMKQIDEGARASVPSEAGLSALIAKSLEGTPSLGSILAKAIAREGGK